MSEPLHTHAAILSTGEEVVEPGGAPGPFQIFNSGSTALSALVESWGARATPLPPSSSGACRTTCR